MISLRMLAVVPRGLEPVAAMEIKELLGLSSIQGDGWVEFTVKEQEDALLFAYRCQSASKILSVVAENGPSQSPDWDDFFSKMLTGLQPVDIVPKELSFAARTVKIGDDDVPSPDIAAMLGAAVKEKTSAFVDLKNPGAILTGVIASDRVWVGLDLTGDDLAKRPYKLFLQGQPIKAPLAYGLVRESQWKPTESLLDPFCQAGTLAIEAALWSSHTSVNKFCKERLFFTKSKLFDSARVKSILESHDSKTKELTGSITAMDESFRSISSAKKNAKIAGVEKHITFSKLDVEWLDVKYGKNGLDRIASFPIMANRLIPQSKLDRIYKEFMHQCDYTLKKKGTVSLLARSLDPWIKPVQENGFKIANSRVVYQGKEPLVLMNLSRG